MIYSQGGTIKCVLCCACSVVCWIEPSVWGTEWWLVTNTIIKWEVAAHVIWINATRHEEWTTEILFIGCMWSDNVILWRRSQKVLQNESENPDRIEAPNYSKGWRMKTWEMSRSGSAAEAGARAGAKLELSVSALVSYNPSLFSLHVEIASPVLHSAHWSGSEDLRSTGNLVILLLQLCRTADWVCYQLWQSCLCQKTKYSIGHWRPRWRSLTVKIFVHLKRNW